MEIFTALFTFDFNANALSFGKTSIVACFRVKARHYLFFRPVFQRESENVASLYCVKVLTLLSKGKTELFEKVNVFRICDKGIRVDFKSICLSFFAVLRNSIKQKFNGFLVAQITNGATGGIHQLKGCHGNLTNKHTANTENIITVILCDKARPIPFLFYLAPTGGLHHVSFG